MSASVGGWAVGAGAGARGWLRIRRNADLRGSLGGRKRKGVWAGEASDAGGL